MRCRLCCCEDCSELWRRICTLARVYFTKTLLRVYDTDTVSSSFEREGCGAVASSSAYYCTTTTTKVLGAQAALLSRQEGVDLWRQERLVVSFRRGTCACSLTLVSPREMLL